MSDVNQALAAAQQRLQRVQDARQSRVDQERRELAEIAQAQQEIRELQRQKAVSDLEAGLQANAILITQNQQAAQQFRGDLNRLLDGFRDLLANLRDDVSPTYDAQLRHCERVTNGQVQALAADYTYEHPETTSGEIKAVLGPQIYERVNQFKSAWTLRTVLATWARDAADPADYRNRAGIVFALLGEELGYNQQTTDGEIQAVLNRLLHDHLMGSK